MGPGKYRYYCWAVIAAEMALAGPALAQVGAGVLMGHVRDTTTRQPVPDVVVIATSPALQGEQIVVTDATGAYRIPNLPPGSYTIRFEKETYKPNSRPAIALRADTTLRLDVEVLPESIKAEEIVIVAQLPTVDVGSSNVGTSISTDLFRRVPIASPTAKGAASKSFESVAVAAPGAQSDLFGTSIAGTTSPENAYIIDGLSANSPAVGTLAVGLSTEFISEINVIAGGYMPEYGRSTGGILSVNTKSGGNEFHGGVWGDWTPGGLAGPLKEIKTDASAIRMGQKLRDIWDIGFDVGGPIQKDKIWFYAGFQYARTVYDVLRTLNAFQPDAEGDPITDESGFRVGNLIPGSETRHPATLSEFQAIGKITYSINQDNRLTLGLIATPSTSGGRNSYPFTRDSGRPEYRIFGVDVPVLAAGARKLTAASYNAQLKWTSEFNKKKVLLDTSAGWSKQVFSELPIDGSQFGDATGLITDPHFVLTNPSRTLVDFAGPLEMDPAAIAAACGPNPETQCPVSNFHIGGPGFVREGNLDRYQVKSVLTFFEEGLGHHVAKAGIEFEVMSWDGKRGYTGGRFLQEDGSSFLMVRGFGVLQAPDDPVFINPLHRITRSFDFGGFLQDSWSIMDQVTLNAGARYDAQYIFSDDGRLGLALPNQISPRLGLIYDPTQKGRAKLFGNYGRFYELVPLDIADRATSGEPAVFGIYDNTDGACDPLDPDLRRTTCVAADRLTPFQGDASPDRNWARIGGPLVPVDPDIKPQSSDEIVLGGEYDFGYTIRAGVSYTKRWLNYAIEDVSRDEAQTYFIGNPGYGIASDFAKAERNYDALTFSLNRSFRDNWQATASYTVAWLKGNIDGLFRPDTEQLDPNMNSDFDLKSLIANRYGYLGGDRRHQIKAFGSYDQPLPKAMHLSFGAGFTATSGPPTNVLGAHAIYGPGEVFILPRGSFERLDWNVQIDGKIGYGVKVWADKTLEFTMDVFNLANFQSETRRDANYTFAGVLPIDGGTPGDLPTATAPGKLKYADGTAFNVDDKNANFNKADRYQQPRYFRFGVRATF